MVEMSVYDLPVDLIVDDLLSNRHDDRLMVRS